MKKFWESTAIGVVSLDMISVSVRALVGMYELAFYCLEVYLQWGNISRHIKTMRTYCIISLDISQKQLGGWSGMSRVTWHSPKMM